MPFRFEKSVLEPNVILMATKCMEKKIIFGLINWAYKFLDEWQNGGNKILSFEKSLFPILLSQEGTYKICGKKIKSLRIRKSVNKTNLGFFSSKIIFFVVKKI